MDYGRNILFSPDKLEKVKPASNRRFRKGDKVRLIYRGREAPEGLRYDKIYTVTENETAYGLCRLTDGVANYSCLELVEAAEESYDIPFHEAMRLMGEGKYWNGYTMVVLFNTGWLTGIPNFQMPT